MKRCPACQQIYTDETLKFCRRDGTPLVPEDAPPADQQETLLRLPPRGGEDAPTEAFCPASESGPVSGSVSTSASLTSPLQQRRRPSKSKTIDSLAVLPLVNASTDAQAEYLSDGITEGIINSLSQLPRLRVVPRATVFRYKGKDADPLSVGRELGVRAVLAGRMLQLGDVLVVKAELIDVARESQVWGEQFRRHLTDIFALEEEISQEISARLRLRLTGEERRRLRRRHTENPDAYQAYLLGRFYTNRRTTDWIKKGVEQFRKAIDLDPAYALAHAGLADAYAFLASSTGECAPTDFYPLTKAAAERALELDDTLAEAHTSLGFYLLMYEWDFGGAAREFERAVELNPNYSNAHDGYSFYFKATGRHERAIAECRRALEADPLSLFARVSLGWAFYFARRFERAAREARRALELDPRFIFAHWALSLALLQTGEKEEALALARRAAALSEGGLTFKAFLAYACAVAGLAEEARALLAELEEQAGHRYVSAYYFAIIHLGLGEHDRALARLEQAFEERAGFLAFLRVEPMLDPLRTDPRFAALESRIGPS